MAENRKPSESEEEYFAREDALKKKKLALQLKDEMDKKEREELKKLHHMHCPKCGQKLHVVDLHGIDVDLCFACGGTWLDKGEIEHLIAHQKDSKVMNAILNWFKDEVKAKPGKG